MHRHHAASFHRSYYDTSLRYQHFVSHVPIPLESCDQLIAYNWASCIRHTYYQTKHRCTGAHYTGADRFFTALVHHKDASHTRHTVIVARLIRHCFTALAHVQCPIISFHYSSCFIYIPDISSVSDSIRCDHSNMTSQSTSAAIL